MEELDLNIENYSFEDILNLFKIDVNFNEEDLKKCYKLALMSHPDKSRLDKKYFLFFSKAFKILKDVYTFKNASCAKRSTTYYDEEGDANEELVKRLMKKKNFNKIFNEQFEKIIEKKNNGYGEWLASDENIILEEDLGREEIAKKINNIKKEQRELVLYNEYSELGRNLGSNALIDEEVSEYTSDVFSKLQYNDVKEVHSLEKSVIPVTEEDFHNRKKYGSVDEMEKDRARMNIDYEEGLREKERREYNESTLEASRAYKYVRELERISEKQKKWWSNFKQIAQ